MFFEDDLPKKPQALFTPAKFESLSVVEMREYISTLRAEIERTEAEIAQRGAQNDAAEKLFKAITKE